MLALCKLVMERSYFKKGVLYVAKFKMLQGGIMGADNCSSHPPLLKDNIKLVPTKSGGAKNTCYEVRKAGRVRPEMIK